MKKACAALLVVLSMLAGGARAADDVVERNTRVIGRLYDELFSSWNLAVID